MNTLDIVTVPHPTLRHKATPVERLDAKVLQFAKQLSKTLKKTRNPKGVGLAAPQVDKSWRIFTTQFWNRDFRHTSFDLSSKPKQIYVNPRITKHSQHKELGPNDDEYTLEGCLSIPKIYGPAPRWEWVELEYETIENDQLVTTSTKFSDFPGRVIQHELDHLDGVLFTDYCLEYDLPLYVPNSKGEGLAELSDRSIVESF